MILQKLSYVSQSVSQTVISLALLVFVVIGSHQWGMLEVVQDHETTNDNAYVGLVQEDYVENVPRLRTTD